MALKKTPAATTANRRDGKSVVEPRVTQEHRVGASGNDLSRLLREAAWSRMFGRVESKNPFTR